MNIHDERYYNWSTFMRKAFMPDKEIRQFEQMGEQAIALELQKIGMSKAGKLFWLVIQSFNIADAVAKAAWGYVKAMNNHDEYNAKEEYASMERGLNDYSPGNFTPHRGDIKFAAEYFEVMYNELQTLPLQQWDETIFRYTAKLHELMATGGHTHQPEAFRVANGMEYNEKTILPCIVIQEVAHIERTDNMQPLCNAPGYGVRALRACNCPECFRLAGMIGA